MAYKNTRRRKESDKSKYILPVLFGLCAIWIIVSSIKDKSPVATLADIYDWVIGQESRNPNKDELQSIIYDRDLRIDSLKADIQILENKNPYRTAIVNTSANSLNLRSDPNLKSDIVVRIPNESEVNILYYNEEVLVLEGESGQWCKIQYADKQGWVWGNYLTIQ